MGPLKIKYARVVKLADTLALEASAQKAWGFKSLREHQPNFSRDVKNFRAKRAPSGGQFWQDAKTELSRNTSLRKELFLYLYSQSPEPSKPTG